MTKPETPPEKRYRQVCNKCRGENVQADAYARWNLYTQEWEIIETYHKDAYCEDCDGVTTIEAEEVT